MLSFNNNNDSTPPPLAAAAATASGKSAPTPVFTRQLSSGDRTARFGFTTEVLESSRPTLPALTKGAAPVTVAIAAKPVATASAAAASGIPPPLLIRQSSLDAKTRDLFVRLDTTNEYDINTLLTLPTIGGKALRLAEMISAARGTTKLTHTQQQNALYVSPAGQALPLPPTATAAAAAAADTKSAPAAAAAVKSVVNVPQASAVTTMAYDQHIARCQGLAARIGQVMKNADSLSASEKESALSGIRATITGAALDASLSTVIEQFVMSTPAGTSFAVRSSSTMEDQKGASYAGQYETYLNVPRNIAAITKAIRDCWASMWHVHILSYREQLSLASGSGGIAAPSMAVVVMVMLNPRASGVLFTLNPLNGDTHQMVIESCYGLGEGVVCGEITPHTYTVEWTSGKVVTRATPKQKQKFAFVAPKTEAAAGSAPAAASSAKSDDKPGFFATIGSFFTSDEEKKKAAAIKEKKANSFIGLVETTKEEQAASSLTDDQLKALVALGLRVASHYEHPQDLEWAIANDGTVYLLQCRPITTFELHDKDGCGYTYGGFTDRCFLSKTLTVEAYLKLIYRTRDAVAKASGEPFVSKTKVAMYKDFFGRFYLNRLMFSEFGETLGQFQSLLSDEVRHKDAVAFAIGNMKHFESEEKKRLDLEKSIAAGTLSDNELYAAFEWLRDAQHTMDSASFCIGDDVYFFEERVKSIISFLKTEAREYTDDELPRLENLMSGVNENSEGKKSFVDLAKFADPLSKNAEVLAWIYAESKTQNPASAVTVRLQPTRALMAKMMADPLFVRLKLPENFNAYVNTYFFMSDDDGDLQNLRFKNDPYIPWCIVFNLLAAAAVTAATAPTGADQKSKPVGDAKDSKSGAAVDLMAAYAADVAKVHAIYEAKYTNESRDQFLYWIEALREGLLWKEKIHIGYTLNHYFLRLVIVECVRRVAAAVRDGTGVFGYSAVDGLYIGTDDIWQMDFDCLSRLLKPPYATKVRGKAGTTAAALGTGDRKTDSIRPIAAGNTMIVTNAGPITTVGIVAGVDDAVAAFRRHIWVRGLLRKMFVAFPPPSHLGGKKPIKIATAKDVVAVRVGEPATGLGCSPGVAVGRARVVNSLEEAGGSVQRGEILITRYTQPSWTPLFALVTAVVLEEGGMLSHAAVVSRECGIASVVQVKDATRRFKTGQLIMVDGTNGTVSLAEQK